MRAVRSSGVEFRRPVRKSPAGAHAKTALLLFAIVLTLMTSAVYAMLHGWPPHSL